MNYTNDTIMKKILFTLLLLALVSCSKKQQAPAPEASSASNDSVAVADTSATDSTQVDAMTSATSKSNEVIFNGTIVLPPQHQATVSLTMGGIIKNTRILPGQYIRKNAIVASIDNPEFISLQQSYLESCAQTEYLKAEYERQHTLASQQAASQKRSQQSKSEYLSMKSKLQASATQLSLLGVSPSAILNHGIQPLMYAKAPISGYVSKVYINIGKYMHTGDPLCEIVDKSTPMLCLTTYEKDVTKMKVGKQIEFHVTGLGDQTFNATIVSIGQNVDQESRSLEVYARINHANVQFRPGMYVTARLSY
jgi:cobalt-zinc-cadmium efflux system membrane fusion protein